LQGDLYEKFSSGKATISETFKNEASDAQALLRAQSAVTATRK